MIRKLTLVVLLLAAGAAGVWYWLRPREPVRSYRFVEIEKGDLESLVSATGTLEPVTTVSVGTQVSGQISHIYADFNDRVKAGQVIARLDTSVLQSAVEEAEAALRRNRAQKIQAEVEQQRAEKLYADGILPLQDLDAARQDLDVTRANVESAEAALTRARRNLSYATIYSPISGTVIARTVDVGQTVAASFSAPELFKVAADLSKMQILASVDESDIGQIHQGLPVRFRVQAYPERTFEGTVSQVRLQPATVENVVNYTVVIAADNPDGKLLPGMTATVDFLVARATDVLKVANAALRFRPTEAMQAEVRERFQRERRFARGDDGSREAADGGGGEEAGSAGQDRRTRPEGRVPGDRTGSGAVGGEQRAPGSGGGFGGGFRLFGGGPGGSPGGGLLGGSGDGVPGRGNRTLLWYLDADGKLRATPVRLGITDGQMTEVEGRNLEPGLQIIVGVTEVERGLSNPLQGPNQDQGRRGFRRPGGLGV